MRKALVAMLRRLREPYWRFKFEEFKRLVQAAGYVIIQEVIQLKDKPKSATLFGRGKIEEMKKIIEKNNIEYVIVYNVLKSIQKANLELALRRTVLDRYDITLEIFANNATDTVSKLQIELAKIQREIPYVRLMVNARFRGDRVFIGAGGEYKWKVILSSLRRRMKNLKEEIERRRAEKLRIIESRKKDGFKIVSIIGYYNAGKTSLFNALTGENKPVSDMPFTTLSSKYSRILGASKILLVDTIGFVVDLDPRIISSFELNIDDIRYSDALIHVIDASDSPEWFRIKFITSLDILEKEGIKDTKRIIALNKIDLLKDTLEIEMIKNIIEGESKKRLGFVPPIVEVSAKSKIGLSKLVKVLIDELELVS